MTAKEYFNLIAGYRDSIEHLKKHIETLREGATAIGGFDYAKPIVQSTPKNVTEDKIIDIADAALKCADMMALWSKRILEADELINQLSRYEYGKIIRLRYLDDRRHSWGWIAEEMGYTEQRVKDIHTEALREFEAKFLN